MPISGMTDMDKYSSYHKLLECEIEGVDYSVRFREIPGAIAVLAPHGGGIEPGTSEVADAIASSELSFYTFEGIKPQHNSRLHITSTKFDEPRCLSLLHNANGVLVIHGEDSEIKAIFIGGRNVLMRDRVTSALTTEGFPVKIHDNPTLQGINPLNICNRCGALGGVQLEISSGFRRTLFHNLATRNGRERVTPRFTEFVVAVRTGLQFHSLF